MSENLPMSADMTDSRLIADRARVALDDGLRRAEALTPKLDRGVRCHEFCLAVRRWLSVYDGPFRGPYRASDVTDMDSGSLQALAIQIDRELTARKYVVTRSVAPPLVRAETSEARDEFESFALGTGVMETVKR